MRLGYADVWVGLDGSGEGAKTTIEQTGTRAICFHGRAYYQAWYELWPKTHVTYPDYVGAGDKISASVVADGNGRFMLTLADPSSGWTDRKPARVENARLASAEVVVEAPGNRERTRKLADFGTVSFTRATANGKSFNDYSPNDLERVGMGAPVKAATSPLSNGAFTVTWKHS